jgi:hypothetical protein
LPLPERYGALPQPAIKAPAQAQMSILENMFIALTPSSGFRSINK